MPPDLSLCMKHLQFCAKSEEWAQVVLDHIMSLQEQLTAKRINECERCTGYGDSDVEVQNEESFRVIRKDM